MTSWVAIFTLTIMVTGKAPIVMPVTLPALERPAFRTEAACVQWARLNTSTVLELIVGATGEGDVTLKGSCVPRVTVKTVPR